MANTMTEQKGPRELLSERLAAIKPDVTAQDRKDAFAEFNLTEATIHKYLKGEGPNADLGLKLYEFFHGKIAGRIERINAIGMGSENTVVE